MVVGVTAAAAGAANLVDMLVQPTTKGKDFVVEPKYNPRQECGKKEANRYAQNHRDDGTPSDCRRGKSN
jgi:hypothetical protein